MGTSDPSTLNTFADESAAKRQCALRRASSDFFSPTGNRDRCLRISVALVCRQQCSSAVRQLCSPMCSQLCSQAPQSLVVVRGGLQGAEAARAFIFHFEAKGRVDRCVRRRA